MDDKTFYSTKDRGNNLIIVQTNLAYISKAQGNWFLQKPATKYDPPYAISTIEENNFNFDNDYIKERLIQTIKASEEITISNGESGQTVLSCKVRLFEGDNE